MTSPDAGLFLMISSLSGNPLIDNFMVLLAEISVFVVPSVMAYLWLQDSKGREDSLLTGSAVFTGIAFTYFMGLFYAHHQPFTAYETIVAGQPNNAFPSQHTALAFSAFWTLLWRSRKRLSAVVGFSGLLAGFARVYVGFHYPVDILGGVFCGLVGLSAAYILSKTSLPEKIVEMYERVAEYILSGKLFNFLHD